MTDLPLPAYEDPAVRVEALLRREVVHRLAGGVAAYSELQECMVRAELFSFSPLLLSFIAHLNASLFIGSCS